MNLDIKYRYSYLICLVCVVLLVLPGSDIRAQAYLNKHIYLKGETINATNNLADWFTNNTQGEVKLPAQVLLQFNVLPSEDSKRVLQEAGVSLMQYIPDNAYTATLYQYPGSETFSAAGVRFIMNVDAGLKMSNELKMLLQTNKEEVEVCVLFAKGISAASAKGIIKDAGGSVISDRLQSMGYCNVSMPGRQVMQLAQSYAVSYATVYAKDVPLNIDAKAITRTQIAASPLNKGGYALKGEGITIGVGDNVSGMYHVDLMDRIINYNPYGYTNHGVHINGIAGGAGLVDPKGEGMAPALMLSNHYFSDVLNETPEISKLHNVIVTNNSYSALQGTCETSGDYNNLSVGLDNLCNAYPSVLQVFAAANNGLFDCPPYPAGFATITGGYQPAKNNLVVASTDKWYVNAENSSRGPVKDGRLKPEISAVGKDVNSTTKTDEYLVASGTSMACPQVAAAAALLAQRLKQINGTTKPRADLLKTLLINGSTDIGNPGPDFRFGFGFLNVERSLIMLDSNRYFTGDVINGQQVTHTINVPANTAQLKVMLCWHDPAASPMASKVLVNDIDIEVTEPGSQVHKPYVLDHTPDNINKPAVEKEDRLNNSEQVLINFPAPGNYTITIKGYNVPTGNQAYVVSYDFLPLGIDIKYPLAGSVVKGEDSVTVYWDAGTISSGKYVLEYTDNDGSSWNVIDNNIPSDAKYYKWHIPAGINSGRCRLRLSRNTEQSITGLFTINKQPEVWLSGTQCPGYMQVDWRSIPNATAYEVMRKAGPVMAVVDTVTDSNYVFSGLDFDSTYYVSVRPIIDGVGGYRSVAVKRRPTDGDCNGSISDGDLMVESVSSPVSGRMFTSTELTANETLTVRIRNLDNGICTGFKLSYSIDGGAWVTQAMPAIGAHEAKSVSLLGLNLKAEGDYQIRVAIENTALPDPVTKNDTLTFYVSQLPNPVVTLNYIDGFETIPVFRSISDTFGIGMERRWDFEKTTDTGQIRSFVFSSITINGQRSLSLDAYRHCVGNFNTLTGTFNLAGYDANADEVRLEFDYIVHGVPKTKPGNELSVRGSDTKPFEPSYEYEMTLETAGKVVNSGSISLSDIILKMNDNFSSSTQLQFGQNDISNIGGKDVGNGLTLDDVRLYTVQNDVQLLEVVAPENLSCGVTGPVPLVVKVRNGVNQPQSNIAISYKLNDNAVVTETLSSLQGKESVDFAFSKLLDISTQGSHTLDVWIVATGDTYRKNDTIAGYEIRNQPLVTTYPYFEDFESGDGYWYTGGVNSSWAYGMPADEKISNAFSGQKAWVTNLNGDYNNDEHSYLYSPCFDLSGMSNPTFSSRIALDIENCGFTFCDGAYIEYTTDGNTWERLGEYGMGTNWYTDSNYQAWNIENKTAWHQAATELPKGITNLQLRYVLHTDPGGTYEGIGIDDIRIYDNKLYVPDNSVISISPNPTDNGIVNIEWAAHSGTEMKIVLTDILGKEVCRASTTAVDEGYNKTTLRTPLYFSGVYFMRIIIAEREHARKIVYRNR